MRMVGRIALWLCQAFLAAMFVYVGTAKFANPVWARMFSRWGYPDHFYLVIGAIEVAAGVGLLVPRIAGLSALTLVVVMAGAGMTHLVNGEPQRLAQNAVLSALLAIVAYGRWRGVPTPKAMA